MTKRITTLTLLALSDDRDIALDAFVELNQRGGEQVFQFYLQLLKSASKFLRNGAAAGLAKMADQRAAQPLLAAIQDPANRGHTDALVYALSKLDCAAFFREIMLVVLYQEYRAKLVAIGILHHQQPPCSAEDIAEVRRHWDLLRPAPDADLQQLGLEGIQKFMDSMEPD